MASHSHPERSVYADALRELIKLDTEGKVVSMEISRPAEECMPVHGERRYKSGSKIYVTLELKPEPEPPVYPSIDETIAHEMALMEDCLRAFSKYATVGGSFNISTQEKSLSSLAAVCALFDLKNKNIIPKE